MPTKKPPISEKDVLAGCIKALDLYPQIRAWRMNTGAAKMGERFMRFGVPGQADITGIADVFPAGGVRLEIEAKSATGRQSESQKAFQVMIESYGGIYLLVRSPEDMMQQLEALGLKPGRR